MSIFRWQPLTDMLISIAKRGYRWYLGLKLTQALLLPLALLVWLAYVAASVALIPLAHALIEGVRVVRSVPEDFRDHFTRKKWLTGFSRSYYSSLGHYKRKAALVPRERA